jgi:hypothetical protein
LAQYRGGAGTRGRVTKTKGVAKAKYRAQPTVIDGRKFPSKVEGRRYVELKRQQDAGLISDLKCQPRFKIAHPVTGAHICVYVGDFLYRRGGTEIIEDVKGIRTDVYVLKRKMMRVLNGLHIIEVRSVRTGKGSYAWSLDGEIETL